MDPRQRLRHTTGGARLLRGAHSGMKALAKPATAKIPSPPIPSEPLTTADHMATKQREISVSEFFLKNRHLLGFDNPKKALLTTIKEAVDNSLDACDEAGILPEISVEIAQTGARRFRVTVLD